jgi:protein gp37
MNKSKIEWCDYTWNPVTGCLHGCEYCYARRIANRFGGASETHYNECVGEECQWYTEETGKIHDLEEPIYDVDRGHNAPYPFGFDPTFHRYRLTEPQKIKKPQKIFVCSMADLFGDWVPDEWIEEVFKTCEKAPQHTYMFLTKNPYRYLQLHIREKLPKASNCWYGTTLTGQGRLPFNCLDFKQNFVSIEPLLGDVSDKLPFTNIQWVIVGAQTGPGAVPPKPEWVQSIIDQCRCAKVPIFLKDNLNWPDKIQEWP